MFMTTNVKCQHFFMHEKYQLQKHLAFYLKYSVAMQLFCIYAVTHFWFYFVLTYYLLIIFLTFYGYFSNFANLLDNALWARSFICILNPVDVIAVAILEVVFCVVIAPCAPPADES